jgi:tetratricopeptide (TPR) repeat protein
MLWRSTTVTIGAVALATALFALAWSGALPAPRAAREAALEAQVRSADIEFLARRVAADSSNWLLASHLADLYAARFRAEADPHDIARAERLVRRTLAVRPDPVGAWVRLSSLLLAQHRFREAFDAARAAMGPASPGQDALAVFIDAARALGEDDAADSALVRLTPGTFAYAIRTSNTLAAEDAVPQVQRACARLAETGAPRDLRAWCLARLASLEIGRGRIEAGRDWLERALRTQPGHRGALEEAADLARAEGRLADAHRYYSRILSDAHPDLYLRLAELERHRGRAEAAASHERRFLAAASDPAVWPLYRLELALYHARCGRCGMALPLVDAELTRRHSVQALEGAAWIRYECGDRASARVLLERTGSRASATGMYLRGLLLRDRSPEASARLIAEAIRNPAGLAPYALLHLTDGQGAS